MGKISYSVIVSFGLIALGFCPDSMTQAQQLLQQTDLTYVGSFRLPGGSFGMPNGTFHYSNGSTAGSVYNDPVHGKSLFITGYLSAGYVSSTPSVAQVTIPALKDAYVVGIEGLNTASAIQGFADPSNGKGSEALNGREGCVALVCYNGKLIGTENVAYDASCSQTKSAWVSPISFAQASQATGPYAFTSPVGPRFIGGGYMALIPPEWQTALGGKVVSGIGPWSIISCGSPGPALHVIDVDLLVTQPAASTAIPSTPLVYYVEDGVRCSLGSWNSNDPDQVINGKTVPSITLHDPHGRGDFSIAYEDNSMRTSGVLFADNTQSVLFFGHKGLGPYCYGTGGTGGECYDPESDSKGDHAYPYTEFVWAYDVNDLIAVKNGDKEPWEVLPYTGWIPIFPEDDVRGSGIGVAWDPETRLAYLVKTCWGNNCDPIVHAFHVRNVSSVENPGFQEKNNDIIFAHPNPFNPVVTLSLSKDYGNVQHIRVYNIKGLVVTDLKAHAGTAIWDASNQPSGIYIVQAQIGDRVATKSITLWK